MAYPDKPTDNYVLRDYDFAQGDDKKTPMGEYLFKNGYKNADESESESIPDSHEQNWLFDLLHRNLRYAIGVAEENKNIISGTVTPKFDNYQLLSQKGVADGYCPLGSNKLVPDAYLPLNSQKLDILQTIYPVGSIYLTIANYCPLASLFGSWELVSSGKALWTGGGGWVGNEIAAGLPNITGRTGAIEGFNNVGPTGAFYLDSSKDWHGHDGGVTRPIISFNASLSSSIYGKSSTVQPPAYVVNAWQRYS